MARKRKRGRTGPGRDQTLGQRFDAAVDKRLKRRKLEKAGRKAARRRK